ncbi:MAG: glycosyltransferase [Clostridium butyricum]|nr:glycosyltransferase [Clostridium butyricum]
MKLVHVIHCCSAGGAEVLAKSIITSIKNLDSSFEIELWVIYEASVLFNKLPSAEEFEKVYKAQLENKNITVKIAKKNSGIIGRISMMRNLRKFYSDFKPDIIHCHLETVTFHVVLSLLFKKVKIIETIHNIKINHKNIHKFILDRKIFKYVAISKKVEAIIKSELKVPEDKIETIYNGIDIKPFEKVLKFKEKVNNIVCIGRLSEQKDHVTLLKAFKILKEKCIENGQDVPNLNIVGDGELREALEKFAYQNNLKEVKFYGVNNQIPKVLSNNEVYVMSSAYEGLSLSLMEALASGISIVCTDVGSNSEIVKKDNGCLVEKGNYYMMADALYKLINNVEMRRKFYLNNRTIYKKFDIVECAENHIRLYKSLLERKINILYIGSLSKENRRLDGVTVKSTVLEKYLKRQNEFNIKTVDVDNWQKKCIRIIARILKNYIKSDKIIICSSSRGAYILLNFLYYINNKKPVYYFVAGGMLGDWFQEKKLNIKVYKKITMMYCESEEMVEKIKKCGINSVQRKNNFRNIIKRPKVKNVGDIVKFVFYSRVVKEKGIEELIREFKRLKIKCKDIRLDIYGQVNEDYLKSLKNQFGEGICYRGLIEPDGESEYEILSQYDVFVLPTYHCGEGLPGALIDAYISGLAVLVSNWKFAHEFVDDNEVGLIHEYKNFDDLYNKMEFIVKNKDVINTFKKNSFRKADEFFVDNVMYSIKHELIN